MKRYDPQSIEPKWQSVWERTGLFRAADSPKEKAYVIPMFPYPSGDGLHVGHPRPYTAADITSHYQRYRGRQVLHATGWDAFGLPAENAAIKKGVHPAENTARNIENFRRQLKSFGFSYDWEREVNTSDPAYYKWTQWIFLQLFQAGLAYRGKGWQWWCPADKTVLANEQVIDGHCERCDTEVTKKELTQWYFKVTDYADELIDNLDELDWPEFIKTLQRNWIGRSEGADITFATEAGEVIVYTTRPDTVFGATYLVLAPEHPLVSVVTTSDRQKEVNAYVERAKKESDIARTATDKEKTGAFTGAYATNPASGERIPIWIADYVLATYGTGAIMAVPAHDQRDYDFAIMHDLPVRAVVIPETGEPHPEEQVKRSIVALLRNPKDGKLLTLDWQQNSVSRYLFIGGGREEGEEAEAAARREIAEETGYTDVRLVKQGGEAINHYYSVARQGYFNTRAELLLFELVSEKQQTVSLEDYEEGLFTPEWVTEREAAERVADPMHAYAFRRLIRNEVFTDEGTMAASGTYDGLSSPEAREQIVADQEKKGVAVAKRGYKLRDWLISRQRYWGTPIPIVHCKKCGPVAVPEDQLPVELPHIDDYLPTGDGRSPLAKVPSFVKAACPECGGPAERETDTMDTFADSSWYFLRYPDPHDDRKAWDAKQLSAWAPVDIYVGGADHAVLHLIYARFWTMALSDLGHVGFREPFRALRHHGMIKAADGSKMSKSKGNVINPDEIVAAYGADTMRVYEMFIGPYDQAADWSAQGVEGAYRFLKRVWAFGSRVTAADEAADAITATGVDRSVNQAIKRVTRSIEGFRFNTAVSALMEALNEFYRLAEKHEPGGAEWQIAWEKYLILLSPLAPHLAEELWQQAGHQSSIFTGLWPALDAAAISEEVVTIVVQVNGKVRANLELGSAGLSEAAVTKAATADEAVQKYLSGPPKKVIYVPGKLINLVV